MSEVRLSVMEGETEHSKLFAYVDKHAEDYVALLAEAVAIPSVSALPEHRLDVVRMARFLAQRLERLGAGVTVKEIGNQRLPDGSSIPLPPVILATYPKTHDPEKKTLCVYGHFDVQPAALSDGWDTDPWTLTLKDGNMYGRGSTDDKGPVLAWILALEAMSALGIDVPVNIRFVLEGMEESGSVGLAPLVFEEAATPDGHLQGVDFTCISDNYWVGTEQPCVTYGLRGIAYFFLEVSSSSKDLHSGVVGGAVPECMTDLVHLMASLVDSSGKILVPGICDDVKPLTAEEDASYADIAFDADDFREAVGVTGPLLHDTPAKILQHRWRYPTLSLHGIEGAFSGAGGKTVIPGSVVGKFSLRLVPDMDPVKVEALVKTHLSDVFSRLGSSNTMNVVMGHGARAWLSDVESPSYVAGRRAMHQVWGVEPNLTREGGSIPITLTFEEATKKPVLLLPVGQGDDGAHGQNEKMSRLNYINAVKTMGAFLLNLGAVASDGPERK